MEQELSEPFFTVIFVCTSLSLEVIEYILDLYLLPWTVMSITRIRVPAKKQTMSRSTYFTRLWVRPRSSPMIALTPFLTTESTALSIRTSPSNRSYQPPVSSLDKSATATEATSCRGTCPTAPAFPNLTPPPPHPPPATPFEFVSHVGRRLIA